MAFEMAKCIMGGISFFVISCVWVETLSSFYAIAISWF